MIQKSKFYALVKDRKVLARGSKKAMRALQKKHRHTYTGLAVVLTSQPVGYEFEKPRTGFERRS